MKVTQAGIQRGGRDLSISDDGGGGLCQAGV